MSSNFDRALKFAACMHRTIAFWQLKIPLTSLLNSMQLPGCKYMAST